MAIIAAYVIFQGDNFIKLHCRVMSLGQNEVFELVNTFRKFEENNLSLVELHITI